MSHGASVSVLFKALVLGLVLQAASMPAAAQSSLEYSVKANYLVRFAAFVEWPGNAFQTPQAPLVICVAGADPFGASLQRAAAAQTAHGRAIAVRRAGAQLAGCHIVYVGQGLTGDLPSQRGMLVVTDAAVSSRRGMIHFMIVADRVRFHIDLQAATAAGLSISSRLLNLALGVRGG